jgi:iron complex outermembrane recepter protein
MQTCWVTLRRRGRRFRSCLGGAVICLVCGSGGALGQTSVTLDELQVFGSRSGPSPQSPESPTGPGNGYVAARSLVGTKTDTPILETPQSVSVVTKQQIQRQGAQAVSQALAYSAGVQTEPFGNDARYDVFIIRGFAASQFGNYKDGLRQGNGVYAYFRNEPYETERIEVLRGPTSVLFGANDPGGLVNLVSKVPTAQPFHEAGPDIGTYGRYQGRFDVSGPAGEADGVLYRVTGLVRQSGTQIPRTPDDRISLAPAATVRLGDATTLTVLGEVARNHTTMWPFFYRGPTGTITRIGLSDPNFDRFDQSQYQFGYRLESRPGGDVVVRQGFRVGGVDFLGNLVDGMGLASNGSTLNRYAEQIREHLSVVTVDNNVQAGFETGPLIHTGLIGLDYFHQDTAKRELYGTAPGLDLRNPVTAPYPYALSQMGSLTGQSLQQVGLYGQDQIALGRFRLTAGLRQDFASLNTLDRLTLKEAQTNPSALTGRVGLTYLFDNGVAPYANYATSFLPQGGTQSPRRGSTPFEPSEGESYEVGVKYQPVGMNALFTASLYDLTKSNVQTPDPQDPRYFVQTGAITVKGAEFEGVFSLGDGFSGIVSYAHTDARVTKSNGADRGKVPVGVPLEQAGLFLDYTVPSGELAGFGGGAGLRYTGRTKADPVNTQTNPTLTALDLSLHYEVPAVRFAVTARNVADQRRGICTSGFCRLSLGRTLLASVSVQW